MMLRSLVTRLAFLSVLLLASLPLAAHAQQSPRPSAEECAQWQQGLAVGGEAALHALAFGWLAACDVGAVALAEAIRASATEQGTAFLFELAIDAGQIRDVSVLDAALEVAADQRASRPARAAAILVLVAHVGSGWVYPGVTGSALLTEPLPREGLCGPGGFGRTFATDNGLPPDHRRRIAVVLDQIAGQGGHPLLRNLARCSRPVLGPGIPPQIDVSKVTLRNVCGTTFGVHNNTPEFLIFSFSVVGAPEHGDLPIEARKRREFTTTHEGTVQLLYDDRIIQTASSGSPPCR